MTEQEPTTYAEKANRRMNLAIAIGPLMMAFSLAFFASIDGKAYAAAALIMAGSAWGVSQIRELDD